MFFQYPNKHLIVQYNKTLNKEENLEQSYEKRPKAKFVFSRSF